MTQAQNTFVYGTVGAAVPFPVGAVTINYDYTLKIGQRLHVWPKLTLGVASAADFEGGSESAGLFALSSVILIGTTKDTEKSKFFELNLGYQFLELEDLDLLANQLYCFAGLRVVTPQKEGITNRYFWRLGLGIPEFIQFSAGVNF